MPSGEFTDCLQHCYSSLGYNRVFSAAQESFICLRKNSNRPATSGSSRLSKGSRDGRSATSRTIASSSRSATPTGTASSAPCTCSTSRSTSWRARGGRLLVEAVAQADHGLDLLPRGAQLGAEAADVDVHLSLIHISEPTRLLSISYAVFCLK